MYSGVKINDLTRFANTRGWVRKYSPRNTPLHKNLKASIFENGARAVNSPKVDSEMTTQRPLASRDGLRTQGSTRYAAATQSNVLCLRQD